MAVSLLVAGCPGKSQPSHQPEDAGAPGAEDAAASDGPAATPAKDGGSPDTRSAGDAKSGDGAVECASNTLLCNGVCLAPGQSAGNCKALFADANMLGFARAGQYLYYTVLSGGLKRAPIAGGPPENVSFDHPDGLVGDATHVYFYTGAYGGGPPKFYRIPVAGGPTQELATSPGAPKDFAIDGTHLYFVHEGRWNGFMNLPSPAVHRVPLAGGPVADVGVATRADWIGIDGSDVYWADVGVLWKTAKATAGTVPLGDAGAGAGGAVQVIDTRSFSTAVPYGIDEQFIYWPVGGRLARAPKAGGGMAEEVATEVDDYPLGEPWPDATDVYVPTAAYIPVNKLLRFHKADRTITVVATWEGNRAAADATHVYLRGTNGILAVAK